MPLLFLCQFGFGQIYNVEQRRLITDTTGWAGLITLSATASQFTKSVFSINAGSHLQYKTEKDLFLLILNYDIVNANGENFDNRAYAHFRYNRKLNDWIRAEYFFQIQNNALIKIQQRILNGIGPRLKLADQEKFKLYIGVAYMNEYEVISDPEIRNRDHRISSYFTFLLLPREDISITNTTYVQPLINNFNDYRVSNDSNLNFSITANLKFTTVLSFFYDARPPAEVPGLNYNIRNGITYKF